jgi:hypothetical protein
MFFRISRNALKIAGLPTNPHIPSGSSSNPAFWTIQLPIFYLVISHIGGS